MLVPLLLLTIKCSIKCLASSIISFYTLNFEESHLIPTEESASQGQGSVLFTAKSPALAYILHAVGAQYLLNE